MHGLENEKCIRTAELNTSQKMISKQRRVEKELEKLAVSWKQI